MAYYNCSLMSDSEIQEKYPNLLKDGYTPADIRTEITAWQDKQRKTLGESYKYDSVPLEKEIYNRIEEKELAYYNSPAYEKELQDILAKAPRDKEGHLLAPNGKPTNLTERQYAQVRTKSFKRWFGDWINNPETASKVVDENGEPLVVYSGRKKNEFEFKNRLKGFYATNSKYIADTYAKNYNGATYEIFLNIKNPYKINDSTRIKLLNEEEQYAYRKWQMLWDDKDVEGFLGEHDGGIYNGGSEYLVINSNQIKSATDNIGTFSTEDANIYKHLLYKDIISEKDYIDFLTEFELNRDKTDDFLYNFITKILQVNPRNKRDKSIPLTVQNYPTSNKVFINYKSERAIINRILGLSADFSFDSETFEKDLKDYIENKWEKDLYEELIRLDKELLSNLNHLYKERAKVQNNISLLQVYLNHREQSPKEVLEYVESFKSTKRKTTSLAQHIGYELKKKKSELAILDEKIKHYRFSNASRTLKVKNRLAALYNIDNVKELVFNRIKADRDSYKLPKEEWEKKIAPYMSLYEKAKKASKNAELLEYNNPIFENKKSLDEISVNELYNKLIQLNPKMKSFLEFIKLVNPKLKIKVYNTEDYNNLAEREDSYISGQSASIFFPRKNEVAFRLNADTSTILHELLHSVSSYGLIGSSEEQKALGKNVIQPFIDYIDNYLKQNVGNFGSYSIFGAKMPATIYGLTNPAEFIAELFSNKDFQELLDAIPPMEKKQYSSLLEEIIDSILNFVKNIFAPKTNETALDQAIQLSLAVIRTQYENIDEIYEQLSNIEDTAQKQITTYQTPITKIISGGQTGVDTIGLQVAKELGIETGGTAPKGFLRETGIDNEDISSYNLVEITDEEQADYTKRKNKKDPYTGRTELNVRNSDGTVYFYTSDDKIGMLATQRSAKEWNKPFIVNPSVEQLRDWIIENNIKVLNVAGNRGSKLSKDNNVAKVLRKALTYSKASEDSTIEEPQQIPVYQTPTLEEDTKINAAFPNTSIRRDRVNLIKRLIYKGLSKEYDRQLAELEQRILDANNIEGEEERQKVISELESSKNSLTEDKAIELGIGNVIKEVKETLNPDSPSNSKEAERARLMKIEGFRKLDSEKQEQIVENNYQKKNKAYRIIQDNWNSLIDEVLPLINDEYGLKIDKSSEPDIDEDAGRDMYQVKARNEDMRSSLSKEIKKLISNVRWIRPDGKILKDDLGFAKYLNSDYVHISLLESLSKARSCMDFWNIFENLALKKPWVNELKKELDKNESLKSKFYQDFRKEFIPYWIEYEYETNKKTGQKKRVTKRVNKTAFLYNTLDSWKDNLEGGTILNDFHIFNEDRSINNDNIEKVLKVVTDLTSKYQEAHNNSLTSGRQEVIDFISDNLPRIRTCVESLGLEVDSDSLSETLNEKDANISELLSVTSEMLNKIKNGSLEGKDINNNPIQLDFFDVLGGYATRISKVINTIDKDSVLKSFRESGKSYQSYTVPSYFGKVLENLKNGSAEDIRQYLMNNYGKYEWFYDHNTNQWRNEWLRAIYENPDKYKNIIERKVVLHSDKKDFNDWGDKQYALSMLTEFGLEDKSKKTAYYYLPVLADAESAEFIQFERFIGSDDKFKSDIRKKLSSVVWQEYYRIQLVKQRKKEGATPIDNFDKRGEKFCFIPELNTLKDNNGKLFIDSLTSYIINGESLEADTLIDYALDKILTDGFTDFYNKLNETGVLAQTKDNKNVFFGYSAEDMNNALVNFYYNNALAQTQIIELLTTDLAFYKSLNDFQKRFKEVYVMNRKLNTTSKYGRKFEKTVILKDLKIKAPSYDTIKEILDKAVEDKRISTSTRDRILGLYADGKVNVTDAQAFRSLSSYKAVLDMAGRWTNEMDEAMDRMKDGSFSDEDFETIFQTIKPFVYTQTTKSTGVKITKDFGEYLKTPMQCKNSEFLLINALNTMVFALSDSGKLKAIEQFMEDYNVDVVQFESAVKCGGQGKLDLSTLSDSDYNGVYDYLKKTTGFNVDSENGNSDYVTIIDYEDYGIQTENPEHLLDTQALFGTQIRKLIFEDMPNDTKFTIGNKEFTKEELWGLYNKLLSSNVFLSYKEIEKEFGSIEGVAKIVQKQVKENPLMYSEELRKACELVEVKDEKTGEVHKEFNLPIYDPVQRNRIEALLLSVIKNTVVKQKIKGASCVQVSCFGTTDSLHIERTEDGGIKYIECYLPAYSKKFFQSFFKKDKDGKPYLDINELPEDLRRCIGYRIPTEGHYSMQPLYIKGFLPVQNGSMIMLPAEITQLTGSDFDIDKVFLMLPEFNIGDYIKKEKLKKDFKKYLEENKPDLYKKYISEYTLRDRELKSFDKKAFENDFDITLKQIIHNTDEESALRLPQNFSEDTFEMELFDFLNDNKNKYSSKLSKVKYDFNKSFEENLDDKDPKEARRRINNALMDIMYGILTSKEAAPKILDGGNFDLAKKGDRICQIADNLKGENISTLADELEVEHSYKAVLDKLESMNVKQLNKILEDIQGELSPITPTTNLYFHSQNANGGKMIGVYANNSVANAMFQMANITLVENEKTGIMPVIFGGKEFKKFGNFYDMNGNPISRNIKNFLAASVDNVKDPVLKGLMQNPVTGSITCMLINLGIDIDSVGLFLNQPMIKEVISIMEDDREVSCETAVNRVLKNHNLLSIEVEDKIYQNYSNLMKEDLFKNIINESDVADIVFLDKFKEYMDKADNYRKIVSILRGDTSKGSIESTIAGCLKRINDFLFLYKKNPHFHIGNLLTLLTKKEDFDNFEDYYKNIENSSIPFISSFTSSGILATESLLKPYTPFFNSSITSILFDDNYGITSLYTKDVIPENVFESVMNDWFLFVLNKGEFFNSTKTENITRYDAEDRDYFINKFPEDFKKLKETIPELKDNQFIKKIIPVYPERKNKNGKRSKGYFPFTRLKFQNSGSLSQLQIDNYSRDWLSLLSSNDIRLNKLGRALFKYATYFGFGFSPESFIRMASVNARKSIPDYVETIKNIDNFNDESKNSLFVFQYLLNHTNDDNLVPNIEIDTRNISNSVVTFSPENVKLFDKVVVNHFKNGDNYYQVVRPVIKVTINGETKVYSTSKVVTPMGEEVHYYETIPLGYKGKVFEYQYNSVPSSVINKTSSIDNSEIESSEEDDWGDNGFTASDERSSNIKNNNIPQQKSPDSLKDIDCNPIGDVDGKVACVI